MGDIILVAGQIPLVPGNMNLLDMNIKRQCRLTLRHIDRIVKAMDAKLRDIVQGVCFLAHSNYIADARKEWERRTRNAIVDYVVVPNLPRGAQVEWCVWAHRDNNRFECKCKIFNKKSHICELSRKPLFLYTVFYTSTFFLYTVFYNKYIFPFIYLKKIIV